MSAQEIGGFFSQEEGSLELFEMLNNRILEECGEYSTVHVKVQKTQITYSNLRVFACVSLLRVRRKSEMPHPYITVTFGLGAPCNDKRIAVVTEAAPNRWTHHTLVHSPEDIDDVLLGWLKSAAQFSIEKGFKSSEFVSV